MYAMGRSWLKQQQEHFYWQHVWSGMPKQDRSYFPLWCDWLRNNPRHHSWRFIWGNLFTVVCEIVEEEETNFTAKDIEKLREIGYWWLKRKWWSLGLFWQRDTETKWGYVPLHNHWAEVWKQLYQSAQYDSGKTTLLKIALKRFQYAKGLPQSCIWSVVIDVYYKENNEETDWRILQEGMIPWLEKKQYLKEEEKEWPWTAELLAKYCMECSEIDQKAKDEIATAIQRWLEEQLPKTDSKWSSLWGYGWALQHGEETKWIDSGMEFLQEATACYRALWKVWSPLWQASETNFLDRTQLLPTGLSLLNICSKFDAQGKTSTTWLTIWTDLWGVDYEQTILKDVGLTWLREAMKENNIIDLHEWEIVYYRLQAVCRDAELENFRYPSTASIEVEQAA